MSFPEVRVIVNFFLFNNNPEPYNLYNIKYSFRLQMKDSQNFCKTFSRPEILHEFFSLTYTHQFYLSHAPYAAL